MTDDRTIQIVGFILYYTLYKMYLLFNKMDIKCITVKYCNNNTKA